MSVATSTRVCTRASVAAAGTSVSPGTPIPDNCHTVIFLNRSAANGILIGQGAAGGALADDGSNTYLPPSGTLTWEVGYKSQRVDDLTDLIFDAVGGAADCDITYLCHSGAS